MGGYLATYRAGEERRHTIIFRALIAALVVAVIALVLYFVFRNYREEQRIKGFLESLRRSDYAAGYAYWGCSTGRPCHDYDYAHFLEDWGPQSRHSNIALAKVVKTKSCSAGIIQFVDFPGDQVKLWVDRKTLVVGFAPWPVCEPRMQVQTPSE